MGSGSVHMAINILGTAAILLIAVRYSTQMSQLIGSASQGTSQVFSLASGLAPQGYSVPAAAA